MLGQGENVPGPGRERALPFFQPTTCSARSCPSFSLGLFYFHNVSQIQAKGITLQCASPRKEFTFWLFAPWFWYFWHSFATRLSTLLLNYWFSQPKRLPFFIKNLNLFSFLLYQQKKIHCINYVLLFSYILSSEITLKSDAIYWHCFFIIIYFFLFTKKMIIIISSTQKWDSPGNVPCIHELNCIVLSSPQAETEKQSKFVFLVLFIWRKVALGRVEGSPTWPSYLGQAKFKNIFSKHWPS